jgi:hypothetical protein
MGNGKAFECGRRGVGGCSSVVPLKDPVKETSSSSSSICCLSFDEDLNSAFIIKALAVFRCD